MSESNSHKRAKARGLTNPRTEVPISRNRRLDAKNSTKAREVERSGNAKNIRAAISRLNTQRNTKKELLVPNRDLDLAKKIANITAKGKLTIQNIGRTKRRFVK